MTDMKIPPQTQTQISVTGLRVGVLGFPALLAQSIALISPTMTAALILPLAFSNAGEGTWMAYLFGTGMLLLVVFNLNQFARRSTSPGSMYAYIGRGLGPMGGVTAGWTLLWCYLFIGIAGLTGFTIFGREVLSLLGIHGTIPSVAFFAVSAAVAWALTVKDVRLSSMLMLVLEGLSVLFILALACVVLFRHGIHIDTDQVALKGTSVRGMSFAVVACIFSLVGFESATAMGGEARDPMRTIPRAVIWSLVITGLFFVFMSYVEVYGTRGGSATLDTLSMPLNTLAETYDVSYLKLPLSLGAVISFFALTLSCLNAGARIIYPMARHSVFPAVLGTTHRSNATPAAALTAYILVMFAVPAIWSSQTDTLTIFNDAGTLAAFGFLLAYFLVTVAAPVYLRKIGERTPRSIALSVAAFLCLLVPTVGSFYPLPAWPVSLFPYLFLTFLALGGIWLYITSRRHRGILTAIETDLEATHG
ncbi:APC family permease [Nocardia sp. alder85J]|uniref:APC family permease n=1 Tax=Nocardia sp. alder85J TaxID=2862949 RepID=UPI001CD59114|nr:APC family permease [Nocardia sp. alder85J]MCX4098474.1 APC family permease [Nocardia sp. alder85J]